MLLIADEILAVGDFLFQQKCEKRMQELMSSGTVILVSHSMRANRAHVRNKATLSSRAVCCMQGASGEDVHGIIKAERPTRRRPAGHERAAKPGRARFG